MVDPVDHTIAIALSAVVILACNAYKRWCCCHARERSRTFPFELRPITRELPERAYISASAHYYFLLSFLFVERHRNALRQLAGRPTKLDQRRRRDER